MNNLVKILGAICLLMCLPSCTKVSKNLVSRLPNGEVRINYEKLLSASCMNRQLVYSSGAGKSESDNSLSDELRIAWFFPGNKSRGIGSYIIDFSKPEFNPSNTVPEGFIVPVEKNGNIVYYTFIDKDLFSLNENKELKFEDVGDNVYLMKSDPLMFEAVYAKSFREGYSFYVHDLESFWQ